MFISIGSTDQPRHMECKTGKVEDASDGRSKTMSARIELGPGCKRYKVEWWQSQTASMRLNVKDRSRRSGLQVLHEPEMKPTTIG